MRKPPSLRRTQDLPEHHRHKNRRLKLHYLQGSVHEFCRNDARLALVVFNSGAHLIKEETFTSVPTGTSATGATLERSRTHTKLARGDPKHLTDAGDCPKFYDAEYFLSKEQVDSVGVRIDQARKKRVKTRTAHVPDEAIDECQSSHLAGSGSNSKTNMETFDDGGVMALVCRHNIPLFLANIDTPGEQQKYGIALIEHLFNHLPENATVAVIYDVACVLDRSLDLYDLLPDSITERLMLATSAMHAYVHQWACQLVYNPRLRVGLGLTDGEGVERLWSRLRKLIGVTRSSSRQKRLWMLDRQAGAIGQDLQENLGDWIRCRLKAVGHRDSEAQTVLAKCSLSLDELREQWRLQREAQLSIRAHHPVKLKKHLNSLLNLQGELYSMDKSIEATRMDVLTDASPQAAVKFLEKVERAHEITKETVEALYAALDVHESFPELEGVDLDFVRTLLMARDLKINIRKRAVGSFFEWDRLDQATGGRHQALGTKLHQATRAAIKKRTPALINSINKFNTYCATLDRLHKPEWGIPIPEPLPTLLGELREDALLMQDVWITRTPGKLPRWLEDSKVRNGIRAMLKTDRCLEERRRLGMEADNLCRWFGRELTAIERALVTASSLSCHAASSLPSANSIQDYSIALRLQQRKETLLRLKPRWCSPLASAARFDSHVQLAAGIALSAVSPVHAPPISFTWITPILVTLAIEQEEDVSHAATPHDPPRLDPVDDQSGANEALLADLLVNETEEDEGGRPSRGEECKKRESSPVDVLWALPEVRRVDTGLLQRLRFQTFDEFKPLSQRRFLHLATERTFFEATDLDIMANPRRLLNDVCLNGIASLLHGLFSQPSDPAEPHSTQCALFTTFHLPMIRYHAVDSEIWRRTSRTEFWRKRIWILPIHRKRPALHWVLCCVSLDTRELFLFDSFACPDPWMDEIPEIMRLIERLVMVANRKGYELHVVTDEGWTARPMVVEAQQTNGTDCGLWVLATIAAWLRGFHATGVSEGDMEELRRLLLRHLLVLPIS
ncbi:hypothetical protein LshimejAT787_0410820 [Lyophyllum shimeji]|uniref:Ubiquitin-like protease family profile domain-containing protein n=1 Tax=Lyophyllum shimeji TaxID=47721 RepID=A0A9P3PLS7_LYOSH|nr:hypothetical protein LshimejAT787_0410820 [Lyophyllum shimeji]